MSLEECIAYRVGYLPCKLRSSFDEIPWIVDETMALYIDSETLKEGRTTHAVGDNNIKGANV